PLEHFQLRRRGLPLEDFGRDVGHAAHAPLLFAEVVGVPLVRGVGPERKEVAAAGLLVGVPRPGAATGHLPEYVAAGGTEDQFWRFLEGVNHGLQSLWSEFLVGQAPTPTSRSRSSPRPDSHRPSSRFPQRTVLPPRSRGSSGWRSRDRLRRPWA